MTGETAYRATEFLSHSQDVPLSYGVGGSAIACGHSLSRAYLPYFYCMINLVQLKKSDTKRGLYMAIILYMCLLSEKDFAGEK